MLTAFFSKNETCSEARNYTYQEFPQHFVWNYSEKSWTARKQKGSAIGRMHFIAPSAGEQFYLWLLLTIKKGPKSWEDLQTVNGTLHESFYHACSANSLLLHDEEWRLTLSDAAYTYTGKQLRKLFVIIMIQNVPSEPHLLWQEFQTELCDDLYRQLTRSGFVNSSIKDIFDFGLFLIGSLLIEHGSHLCNFPSMPIPIKNWEHFDKNSFIAEQLKYNTCLEMDLANRIIPTLNNEQCVAFDAILLSTALCDGKLFFLHGPGGTGKTFVYKTLCHHLRGNGHIVLCIASSGIAALLLPGGRTAHSMFTIPTDNLNNESTCNVEKNSKRADMLRQVHLII